MPKTCIVMGCKSRSNSNMPDIKFFRFPTLDKRTHNSLVKSQTRQKAWLDVIRKPNFFASHYNNSTVCSLHFVSGKSANLYDFKNPDWVPSLNMGYEQQPDLETQPVAMNSDQVDFLPESDIYLDDLHLSNVEEESDTKDCGSQTILSFSSNSTSKQTDYVGNRCKANSRDCESQTEPSVESIGIQTDAEYTRMSSDILVSLEDQIQYLEEMLSSHMVKIENFEGKDVKTCFFTGITKFETMKALFAKMEKFIPKNSKLTQFQIFFMFLNRLRLNLSFRYLSYQFGVHTTTISRLFYKCLHVMFSKLRSFVYWPSREAIKRTMPLIFQKQFNKSIVVIVDCFEVFIEKPSMLKAASQCWSQYKHAYTIKYLIGINPQGAIQFISVGYGGRASDKYITETSGLFDKLKAGDVVMADRGFLIEEELRHRGVELNIPAFTKGKKQLHPIELEDTRNIANVRIHVERIIGQLRQKFSILHQFKFPLSMVTKKTCDPKVTIIDQIVLVCCALCNLCAPIVLNVKENSE